jgi:hypothetical protein
MGIMELRRPSESVLSLEAWRKFSRRLKVRWFMRAEV